MKPMPVPHGPGWMHEARTGTAYWLWAPRDDRPLWTACWQNVEETAGDFRRAPELGTVLAIFSPAIRGMFRMVIVDESGSAVGRSEKR